MKTHSKARAKTSLLTQMRDGSAVMRVTASIILLCFGTVFYSPAVNATVHGIDDLRAQQTQQHDVFEPLPALVNDSRLKLLQLQKELDKNFLFSSSSSKKELQHSLEKLADQASVVDEDIADYFETRIEKAPSKLKPYWQSRADQYHADMKKYQAAITRSASLDNRSELKETVNDALALMETLAPHTKPHSYDSFTPFGPLDGTPRPAATTINAIQTRLGWSSVPATPNPDVPQTTHSASTIDAPQSETIRQKAADLNYSAVQIYNWVYNNIRFIPSFGSLQGAEQTLALGAGNATDISSLLVALLRASSIPARYDYGTVRLPQLDVANWVGGVKLPNAAQNLLSQGGIPNILLRINGKDKFFDLEHTWVEAYVDDHWVALDAAFKQYEYTDGVDLKQQVPFDAQAFTSHLQTAATSNEQEGWVQGVDQQYIQTQMETYRTQLESYVNTHLQGASVGDVLGTQNIIQRTDATLPTQLPYVQVAVQVNFAEVPERLRHRFQFELQTEAEEPLFHVERTTIELAGKKLAVSFTPATPADQQALMDFLPANPQTAADLPSTIPAGLMNVKAQFTIDGQVVAESVAMPFGRELSTVKGLWSERAGYELTTNPIITGEYQAIGLDLQGVPTAQLEALRASMNSTQTKLQGHNYNSITKHNIIGDLLQIGVITYLATTNQQSEFLARRNDIVYYREPSYGTLQTNAQVNYQFGQPHSIRLSGVLMDMDRMKSSAECKFNCWENWVDFNKTTGMIMSAYEHLIPEEMFSTEGHKMQGISAVKALAIASAEGQKIYTVTRENVETVISQLTVDENVISEIRHAVDAGYVVTTSQHNINFNGWSGSGYVIADPSSGSGAYKISGGANGGQMVLDLIWSALLEFLDLLPLDVVDFILNVMKNLQSIIYQCSGAELAAGVALVASLVALSAAAALVVPWWYAYAIGILQGAAMEEALTNYADLCSH